MPTDGQMRDRNKRWDQLSMKQREQISGLLREEYFRMAAEQGRIPFKGDKEDILARVQMKIEECGIWIPEGEVRRYYEGRILRFRKALVREHPELGAEQDDESTAAD